jgi:ribosomal protein S3
MGQKINPNSLRLELNKKWESIWYSERNYCKNINEDIKIRNLILYELKKAKIGKIMIERPAKKVIINIHTSKPSTIIGKKEEYIMEIKKKDINYNKKRNGNKYKGNKETRNRINTYSKKHIRTTRKKNII